MIDPAKLRELRDKATPGPWVWTDHETGLWADLIASSGMKVCDDGSACGEYSPSIDIRRPNAALIAMTPDLATAYLAALDRIAALEAREKESAEIACAVVENSIASGAMPVSDDDLTAMARAWLAGKAGA